MAEPRNQFRHVMQSGKCRDIPKVSDLLWMLLDSGAEGSRVKRCRHPASGCHAAEYIACPPLISSRPKSLALRTGMPIHRAEERRDFHQAVHAWCDGLALSDEELSVVQTDTALFGAVGAASS